MKANAQWTAPVLALFAFILCYFYLYVLIPPQENFVSLPSLSNFSELPEFDDPITRYFATSAVQFTDSAWSSQLSDWYQLRYNQSVPAHGWKEWLRLARGLGCSLDLSDYDQMMRDLRPFYQQKELGHSLSMLSTETLHEVRYVPLVNAKLDWTAAGIAPQYWHNDIFGIPNSVQDQLFGWWYSKNWWWYNWLGTIWDIEEVLLPLNWGDGPVQIPSESRYEGPRTLPEIASQCVDWHINGPENEMVRTSNSLLLDTNRYLYYAPGSSVVFSQAKPFCFADILLPMRYHVDLAKQAVRDDTPFESKIPALFWRGTTTGGEWSEGTGWEHYLRTRALEWAKQYGIKYPTKVFTHGVSPPVVDSQQVAIDIGLSGLSQCREPVCAEMKQRYPFKPSVPFEESQKYKYLLMLDGNSWPSRLQTYLQLNSLILYPRTAFFDWYSWKLEPWVHFVPIKADLSDLEPTLIWLEQHPSVALRIVQQAQAFIAKFNRIEQMQCHTAFTMMHLRELIK
ncbi:capsule-associated protein CAP1 [Kappamyces sp. JEL0829]|nr:capsule-associated protein CAP1 [Kappamyces sp. JEL0829]